MLQKPRKIPGFFVFTSFRASTVCCAARSFVFRGSVENTAVHGNPVAQCRATVLKTVGCGFDSHLLRKRSISAKLHRLEVLLIDKPAVAWASRPCFRRREN